MSRRGLSLHVLTTFLFFCAMNAVAAIVIRYTRDLGYSRELANLVWSSTFLASMIVRIPAGIFADKTSPFISMALGAAFASLGTAIQAFATQFTLLIVSRIVQGIGIAFFISASIVGTYYVTDTRLGEALGMRAAAVALGALVGNATIGPILDNLGYKAAFSLPLALFLSASIASSFLYRSHPREHHDALLNLHNIVYVITNRATLLLTVTALIDGATFSLFQATYQQKFRDIGYAATMYSILLTAFSSVSIASRILGGRVSNKVAALTSGYILNTITMLIAAHSPALPYAFIPAILYGINLGLIVPNVQYLVITTATRMRNLATAIYATGFDLGGFSGPTLQGIIISELNYHKITFYTLTLFQTLNALLVIAFSKLILSKPKTRSK